MHFNSPFWLFAFLFSLQPFLALCYPFLVSFCTHQSLILSSAVQGIALFLPVKKVTVSKYLFFFFIFLTSLDGNFALGDLWAFWPQCFVSSTIGTVSCELLGYTACVLSTIWYLWASWPYSFCELFPFSLKTPLFGF